MEDTLESQGQGIKTLEKIFLREEDRRTKRMGREERLSEPNEEKKRREPERDPRGESAFNGKAARLTLRSAWARSPGKDRYCTSWSAQRSSWRDKPGYSSKGKKGRKRGWNSETRSCPVCGCTKPSTMPAPKILKAGKLGSFACFWLLTE